MEHYNAVLIEELKGEFRAVTEAVEGLHEEMGRRIDSALSKAKEDLRA